MAISAKAAQTVVESFGVTPGDAAATIERAAETGSATGYLDHGPYAGILITVHHAGDRKFTVELH
jgi:hypothetical protein